MAAEIYISKRCEYCMKLLIELKGRPDLKGSIKIISIDDEPFPNIIKTVPTMISDGQLFTAKQIFEVSDTILKFSICNISIFGESQHRQLELFSLR